MGGSEAFDKLKLLSRQEFKIFKLYCQSWKYKEIAKELLISESAVKNDMGRIYVKLSLDQLPERARTFTMGNVYCPVLSEFEMSTDIDKELVKVEKEPGPISRELMNIVEDGDGGPSNIIEAKVIQIEPSKEHYRPPQQKRKMNPFITGFVIISLISIIFMGYTIYNRFFGTPPSQPQNPAGEITTDVIADEDSKIITTEVAQPAVMPTNIEIIPTEPPTPAPTAPPQQTILFEDNFDDGLSDAWEIVIGSPIIVNGMLSTDQHTWLLVGDPNWKNYSVEFNTDSTQGFIWEGFNIIGVRALDINNMYAYKWSENEAASFIVEDGIWSEIPQSDYNPENYGTNFMISIVDNQISIYESGIKFTSFYDSRFEKGRVILKLFADTVIDNFKVREILE